jgi:peptide/nickel transport system permease protein
MAQYVIRRLVSLVPVMFLVSAITFLGLELVPGDPLEIMLGPGAEVQIGEMSDEQYRALLREYGLDKPVYVRYLNYVGNLLQGDLGRSYVTHQKVTTMLQERLSVSLWLNAITFMTGLSLGVALGVIAGLYHGSKIDLAATLIAVLSVATPGFWIAILLIIIFSVNLGWLPSSGWVSPLDDPVQGFRHLLLPVLALGVFGSASIMRQTRSAVIEVLRQDYVAAARAKGLTERAVVLKHILKNALIPVVTVMGFQVAGLIGGSVLIERVFGLPGIGRMTLDATQRLDYQVVQAVVMLAAVAIILSNLLADLLYSFLDPRIRYE